LRLPGVTDFLVGFFPGYLASVCSLSMGLRMVPVIAAFAAMGGFLWVAHLRADRPKARGCAVAALAAAGIWGAFQGSYLIRWASHQTGSSASTENDMRPENAVLDRFVYDLLQLPRYYSNGKMDPMIESRLLDGAGRVAGGPEQTAQAMEARSQVRLRLVAHPLPSHPGWLELEPGLTIEPGGHELLRFSFDPGQNYSGYLIMQSAHGYHEYHLPDSGMGGDNAFGVGSEHSSVLSLWNTGAAAEHYKLTFLQQPGNSFTRDDAWFADVVISHLEPSRMAVRLGSLLPYRAVVSTPTPVSLETFRAFIPGYAATVDGQAVPVTSSAASLAEVPIPAGQHTVELRYLGTWRLRLAALVSICGWTGLGWTGWRGRHRPAAPPTS
jgi:hypothetical protein